jgi:hypothetical protein
MFLHMDLYSVPHLYYVAVVWVVLALFEAAQVLLVVVRALVVVVLALVEAAQVLLVVVRALVVVVLALVEAE